MRSKKGNSYWWCSPGHPHSKGAPRPAGGDRPYGPFLCSILSAMSPILARNETETRFGTSFEASCGPFRGSGCCAMRVDTVPGLALSLFKA